MSEIHPVESLRDVIGMVSAGAGIFAALLYLAGRSFASGYFEAMNIPSYQVSFSMWEYGEVAWRPMAFYPVLMLGASGLLWAILFGSYDLFSPLLKSVKINRPIWFSPQFNRQTKQWFALFLLAVLVLSFAVMVDNTLQLVAAYGEEVSKTSVLEKSVRIELASANPLALDDNSLIPLQVSGQDYYVYNGFYLLTVNGGKYYLFKEIDPKTCQPAKVYVIEVRESVQVNLLPAVSLADQCVKTKSIPSLPPTPTP